MKQRTFVQAQAYYGDPVAGQRQTLVADVAVQAGGMPYEGDVQAVVAQEPVKRGRGRPKKAE